MVCTFIQLTKKKKRKRRKDSASPNGFFRLQKAFCALLAAIRLKSSLQVTDVSPWFRFVLILPLTRERERERERERKRV